MEQYFVISAIAFVSSVFVFFSTQHRTDRETIIFQKIRIYTRILALLLILAFSAQAQVDYIKFKDQYTLSCMISDSAVIVRNQRLIDSLNTMQITNGEKEFLYDQGWVYYMRYLKWKDLNDLKTASKSFGKSWKKYQDLSALWNLSGIYRSLGNCKKSLDLTCSGLRILDRNLQTLKFLYHEKKKKNPDGRF